LTDNASRTELGEDPSPDGSDLQDPEVRAGIVWFSLAMAGCVIVVLIVVLLLVVQPSKKPAPKQPGSLCWDNAMQMEMPCSPTR
jgi:hypothetical protein